MTNDTYMVVGLHIRKGKIYYNGDLIEPTAYELAAFPNKFKSVHTVINIKPTNEELTNVSNINEIKVEEITKRQELEIDQKNEEAIKQQHAEAIRWLEEHSGKHNSYIQEQIETLLHRARLTKRPITMEKFANDFNEFKLTLS